MATGRDVRGKKMDNTDKVLNIGLAQPLGNRIASCKTRPAGRVDWG